MDFLSASEKSIRNILICSSGDDTCVNGRSLRSVKKEASLSGSIRICFWIIGANLSKLSVWVTRAREIPRCLAMSAFVVIPFVPSSWLMASACLIGLSGSVFFDSKLSRSQSIEASNPNTNSCVLTKPPG